MALLRLNQSMTSDKRSLTVSPFSFLVSEQWPYDYFKK
jgi:hypothetical protein